MFTFHNSAFLHGTARLRGTSASAVAPKTKSLRQRAGEASWRYFLSGMAGFVALGMVLRCCQAGWLA
jgi:hypothetical protein